jgi:hypothetical protein
MAPREAPAARLNPSLQESLVRRARLREKFLEFADWVVDMRSGQGMLSLDDAVRSCSIESISLREIVREREPSSRRLSEVRGGFVPGPDRRSPLAVSFSMAAILSSIGLEFALPMLLGLYLDQKLGTKPVLLLIGMALGFATGIFHLVRIARGTSKPN